MDQTYEAPLETPSSVFRQRDPAQSWPGAPPNFGMEVVPHVFTVAGTVGLAGKANLNADEALRHSPSSAARMRADCGIMECLEARQRATALLNWHIEPEDKKDAKRKELVADLTAIVERSKYFMEWRHSLMQAIWYGHYATANQVKKQSGDTAGHSPSPGATRGAGQTWRGTQPPIPAVARRLLAFRGVFDHLRSRRHSPPSR